MEIPIPLSGGKKGARDDSLALPTLRVPVQTEKPKAVKLSTVELGGGLTRQTDTGTGGSVARRRPRPQRKRPLVRAV
ncbi:MAG: hypothetical protein E7474_13275 [Ruminococcaceae bacterium]|nr:hypothetical protein [Oscillospiraceae bacterium]